MLVLPAPLKPVSQSVGGGMMANVGCGMVCPCSMSRLQYSKAPQKNLSPLLICPSVCARSYCIAIPANDRDCRGTPALRFCPITIDMKTAGGRHVPAARKVDGLRHVYRLARAGLEQ